MQDLFSALDDTRFQLIVISQPAETAELPELAPTLAASDDPHNDAELRRARIPTPSFYLLRPDGHIRLAGARLDPSALSRYMREHVGLSPGRR